MYIAVMPTGFRLVLQKIKKNNNKNALCIFFPISKDSDRQYVTLLQFADL